MDTKQSLLAFLEAHRGNYFSGEELAGQLGLSRTAVWKAVNTLREQGYEIEAAPRRGYCLSPRTDILSEQGIRKHLRTDAYPEIRVEETVTSTNAVMRTLASQGAPEGTVLIASAQTQGRGRLGRQFFSPPDTGIYLSVLLRPRGMDAGQAVRFTSLAAVAACRAVETVSGRKPQIKWVNDLYLDGKKICGILTEAQFSLETGSPEEVILGIGMNVYAPAGGFPEALQTVAGAIFTQRQDDGKNRLAAAFLEALDDCRRWEPEQVVQVYWDNSMIVGKQITVHRGGRVSDAVAVAIDEECRLQVRYPDGTQETLSSGEVSIRMETGGNL